jgi:ADP-heptose:LPS heptosyltransferase
MRQWVRSRVVAGTAWVARRRRDPVLVGRAPRIVLVRPDHLGDVLLSTPAIAVLRAALPQAHLVALVGPWGAEALANNPHLDAIETVAFPGFARGSAGPPWRAYAQLGREALRLRNGRFDAAVNLRPDFWWGAALVALAGVPVRIGYDLPPGNRGLTHAVPASPRPEHAARQTLRLTAAAAGVLGGDHAGEAMWEPGAMPLEYAVSAADRNWACAWLAEQELPPDAAPIIIHPGSGAAVKLWPTRLWAQAADLLAAETGAPIVVTGMVDEAALVDGVAASMREGGRVRALVATLPLGRYAALLAAGRLVLGVDSGPLHLAVAVGTPSVRLYGPTDPEVFGPWGRADLHAVVASDLPCAPCGRLDYTIAELAVHPCIRLLTPHQVVTAARRVLAAAHHAPTEVVQ